MVLYLLIDIQQLSAEYMVLDSAYTIILSMFLFQYTIPFITKYLPSFNQPPSVLCLLPYHLICGYENIVLRFSEYFKIFQMFDILSFFVAIFKNCKFSTNF